MIAGADARTCARQTSRHVFYPVFGVPGQDPAALCPMQELLAEYARILDPTPRSRARRSDGKTAAGVRIRAGACIFYQTVNRFCFFCEF